MPVKRTRFAAKRKAVGFSQGKLAERVRVDRSTVVRWERGETDPQPWKRITIAKALGVSVDQLDELLTESGPAADDLPAGPQETSEGPRKEVSDLPYEGSVMPSGEMSNTTQLSASDEARDLRGANYDLDEEVMKRRAFLISTAAVAGLGKVDTLAAIELIRQELNVSLAEEHAGADAAEWQEIAQDYGESYLTAVPAELIESLMVDMLAMQAALRRNEGTAMHRDLLRVAALLSAFTAQTISNMGQPFDAKRWWRTAKTAADRSGDPYSMLWVRGREIQRALESRPVPAILRLIEEADGMSSQAPPAATLALIQGKAQTLAVAGRKHEATQTLSLLRERFGQSPTGFSGSVLVWDQSILHGTESFCYARLGDIRKAETATADGLALYAENGNVSKRHEADLQLYLAFALVRTGDICEGLRHARTVISSLPEAYRENAARDGRMLLNVVPRGEQGRADVDEYREWINYLARSGE